MLSGWKSVFQWLSGVIGNSGHRNPEWQMGRLSCAFSEPEMLYWTCE